MLRASVLSLVMAMAVAAPNHSEFVDCSPFDGNFEHLTQSLKTRLSETGGYMDLGNIDFSFLRWKKSRIGNFSSFELREVDGFKSKLCSDGDKRSLILNLGFNDLEVSFKYFALELPFLTIGGGPASLNLEGETVSIMVATSFDQTSLECRADLESFKIDNYGQLRLKLDFGVINYFFSMLFNNFIAPSLVSSVEMFSGESIESRVAKVLNTFLHEKDTQQNICNLLNYNV